MIRDSHPLYHGHTARLVGDYLRSATNYAKAEHSDPLEKRAADALVVSLMALADGMHGTIEGLIAEERLAPLVSDFSRDMDIAMASNVVRLPVRSTRRVSPSYFGGGGSVA